MRRRCLLEMTTLVGLMALTCWSGCAEPPDRDRDPSTGSESHFLEACEATRDCADGLACHCGVCTKSCADQATCGELGEGACRATDELDEQCSSTVGWADGLCVEPCETDEGCGAAMRCSDRGYCQRRDFTPGGPDAGLDAGPGGEDAGDETTPEPLDPRSGEWEPVGGPPGGIRRLLRVDQTIAAYGLFTSRSDRPLVATSTDGGATWQSPDSEGLDAILAQSGFATAAEGDEGWYVLSDNAMYRRDAEGDWQEVATEDVLPFHEGELHVAGNTLAMVAHDGGAAEFVATSDDGGVTWRRHESSPADRIRTLRTHRGNIYGTGYGGLVVSEDGGETWQVATSEPPPVSLERWVDYEDQIAGAFEGQNNWKIAASSTGTSWETNDLPVSIARLAVVDGTLMGLTPNGTVGEVGLDGSWSPVTDGFDREHDFEQVASVEGGFLAIDGRVVRRWTRQDGWQLSPVGDSALRVTLSASGSMWASTRYLFEKTDEGWINSELPGGGEHRRTVAIGDDIYAYDLSDCLYRRDGDQWTFVLQPRSEGIARSCDRDSGGYRISDLAAVDGEVYLALDTEITGDSGQTGGLLTFGDGEATLVGGAPASYSLTTDGSTLWMTAEQGLIELVDGEFRDRTPGTLTVDGTDLEFSNLLGLEGADDHMIASARTGESAPQRLLRRTSDGWDVLPNPTGEEGARLLEVSASGIWTSSAESSWFYDLESDEWVRVDAGLPEEATLQSISVRTGRVVGALNHGGVWEMVRD